MDRFDDPQREARTDATPVVESTDASTKPKIEPDSWRGLTEFVDQFSDDAVFAVLGEPDDSTPGIWIVRDIEKIRPSAVPIDQPTTFDLPVLGLGGEVVGEIWLTIEEIQHIRAADPSDESLPTGLDDE